jgi:hypothetical protein
MEQQKWLLIENKGEIDINALILMGGSTKRDSTTSIGYYGSGNKYAIALLLKHEIGLKIYAGEKEVVLTTEDVSFREKSFKKILVDGKETSLTTDMGPQWDIWMTVREFVSNAIDEGTNNIVPSTTTVSGKEGYTRIYVEHVQEIQDVVNNWNLYFSFDRTDAIVEIDNKRIYPNICERHACVLYRRGIRCQNEGTSLFHYDLPNFQINESRVIDKMWRAKEEITKMVVCHATKEIAEDILKKAFKEDNYTETCLEYMNDTYSTEKLSRGWQDAIGDKIICNQDLGGFYIEKLNGNPHYLVSKQLARKIKKDFPDVSVYGIGDDDEVFHDEIDQTVKMQYQLKKATEALTDMKYSINYPIKVVNFSDANILGQAKNKMILLSGKLFDKGIREIALTIMEEQEHIETGYSDKSRAFQDHLFNKWLSSMEEHHGVFL